MSSCTPQHQTIIRSITYTVPSATHTSAEYTVTEDPATGERVCTCEANEHPKTRGRCWHLKAVDAGMVKPRIRVTQRPADPDSRGRVVENRRLDPPLPAFTRARTSPEGLEVACMLDV